MRTFLDFFGLTDEVSRVVIITTGLVIISVGDLPAFLGSLLTTVGIALLYAKWQAKNR